MPTEWSLLPVVTSLVCKVRPQSKVACSQPLPPVRTLLPQRLAQLAALRDEAAEKVQSAEAAALAVSEQVEAERSRSSAVLDGRCQAATTALAGHVRQLRQLQQVRLGSSPSLGPYPQPAVRAEAGGGGPHRAWHL